MTTSMTPTHGEPPSPRPDAPRVESRRDGDADRWLPDPSWPVPPRGWQLWAAAGAGPGSVRESRAEAREPGGVTEPERPREALESQKSHPSHVHSGAPMQHTDDVLSELPRFIALEDASFTLPARPTALLDEAWLEHGRVDLLADRRTHRTAPEGTVRGFAVLAALLLISCLVGGVTGGLIVLGVSTLLAASAALVRGHLSLTRVGGQRGAGLLLGAAVVALITGSVTAHDRPSDTLGVVAALVPVSSDSTADPAGTPEGSQTQTSYAVIPPSSASALPAPAATPSSVARPATDGTDESGASLAGEPATPATPAEPNPGSAATPATPATPAEQATPGHPGAGVSVLLSGLTQVGGALTLSPDALSPWPAAVQPKNPKASRIGTAVSAPSPRPAPTSKGGKAAPKPKGAKAPTARMSALSRG